MDTGLLYFTKAPHDVIQYYYDNNSDMFNKLKELLEKKALAYRLGYYKIQPPSEPYGILVDLQPEFMKSDEYVFIMNWMNLLADNNTGLCHIRSADDDMTGEMLYIQPDNHVKLLLDCYPISIYNNDGVTVDFRGRVVESPIINQIVHDIGNVKLGTYFDMRKDL